MSTTIFLSNTAIQIVVGKSNGKKIRIDRVLEEPMPDNTILNGVIVEGDGEEFLTAKLDYILKRHKIDNTVDLVINSPKFMADVMTAPSLSLSKTTSYIDKQTKSDQYARIETPVKGWYFTDTVNSTVVNKETGKKKNIKNNSIIAEVCEKSFIDQYVKVFTDAGFRLNSIHDGVKLADKMLERCVGGATAIYIIRDGQQIVTIFYVKGKYFYDSSKRSFRTPCTEEYAQEIHNNISGIKQFAGAQRIKEPITDVYFAGMKNDEISQLKDYLAMVEPALLVHGTTTPSHIKARKWSDKFSSFIYPIAGLQKLQKGYSILTASRKNDEEYKKKVEFRKRAIPVIVLASILAVITIFLGVIYFLSSKNLKALNDYNSQISVLQASMEYDAQLIKSAKAGEKYGGAELLKAYLETYPLPDSTVNAKILQAARGESVVVDFNSYDAESGVFSITASSYEVENINKFIAKLMELDIFEDVDYTGYEWNDSSETWSIKVICTLKARANEEETK